MERLHKFFRLPPGERLVLVQAWTLLLLMEPALRVLPFQQLRALCNHAGRKRPGTSSASVPSASRLAWLVEVAGRFTPVTATCLKKALVLSWLLGRQGIASTLQIGVARHGDALTAHAWLEQQGQVLFGLPECEGYRPLVPIRNARVNQ